ncbi:MAG TPA: lactonase family protein [Opitutaceae bacterium]
MGAHQHRMFVGTYTKAASRGIYSVTLDGATGALGAPELAAEAPNPTFLALSPDRGLLYAVCAGPAWASSFRVDPGRARLIPVQQQPPGTGPTPCHIAVDAAGRFAVAANYHLALAAAIPLGPDGSLGTPRVVAHTGKGPHPTRQDCAHVHSANLSPDGRFAIVCDLGLDRIYSYRIDPVAVALLPGTPPFIASAPAAGPRHLAFGRSGLHAYVINELDNTVVAYSYEPAGGKLAPMQSVSVLPPGFAGSSTAAEVRVHPGGRFLFGSSRGSDTIAVFAVDGRSGRLSPVEVVPCGGKGPRNFTLTSDGAWLVCAHQDSDTLCSFQVDPATGRLLRIPGVVSVSTPVCVVFAG